MESLPRGVKAFDVASLPASLSGRGVIFFLSARAFFLEGMVTKIKETSYVASFTMRPGVSPTRVVLWSFFRGGGQISPKKVVYSMKFRY